MGRVNIVSHNCLKWNVYCRVEFDKCLFSLKSLIINKFFYS